MRRHGAALPTQEDALGANPFARCPHNCNVFVWAVGEATRMRTLRRALVSSPGLEPGRVMTVGYWEEVATDHRNAAAGSSGTSRICDRPREAYIGPPQANRTERRSRVDGYPALVRCSCRRRQGGRIARRL
ncbi:SIP domain-containing protein [Paraburkholderia sp. DGU8]|uniref:SIP domain-containing protein n=1 Tax=Paraburkholderia sp. DGU8 TaxID=3161997 RepID=UPI0034654347